MSATIIREPITDLVDATVTFEAARSQLSHDTRNRVGAILGFAKIMKNGLAGPVSEDQARFLDIILKNCDEITELIARFSKRPQDSFRDSSQP